MNGVGRSGAADSRLFAPPLFDLFESSSRHSGMETPSHANLRISTKMHKDKVIQSLYGFIFMHFSGSQGGCNQLESSIKAKALKWDGRSACEPKKVADSESSPTPTASRLQQNP